MTEFTPIVNLRIEVHSNLPTDDAGERMFGLPAPTYHVRFADYIEEHGLTVTAGTSDDPAERREQTNENLYELAKKVMEALGDTVGDGLSPSGEPPKDWRVDDVGGWSKRSKSGIAIPLRVGPYSRVQIDADNSYSLWLGVSDPE